MLVVDTYVAPDSFGGKGLFARHFIKKGTVIWTYNPEVDIFYSMEEYRLLPPGQRTAISDYAYPAILNGVMGLMDSSENDRYTNHSSVPNVGPHRPEETAATGNDDVYALADIQAGEEITMDYLSFLPGGIPAIYWDLDPFFSSFFTAKKES